ncbi:hypothetical protein BV22DRAFT_682590 [Leucogyrophana mollusca]|uniref:Uncharacterized protein n=1 Tax=Leucogyrophana mollusca TaxID=85980 RepID=A0ACB8BA19_9AGAM|nr:hypothetical protein BV22DRAFT_682590 [Leucogyrophana mollusca]
MASIDRNLTSNSVSALSFLTWEFCITFGDEVRFVWSKPYKSPLKWLFLLTRYVGLGSLIGNRFLGIRSRNPSFSCKSFLALQVSMCQILVTLVEIILMLRLYALYNRDYRISAFLIFLAVAGTVVAIVGLVLSVPETQFDYMCSITHVGSSSTSFIFTFVIIECSVLLLTIVKCISSRRSINQTSPIIKLMLRDGTLAFLAMTATLIISSILLIAAHGSLASTLYPWVIATYSCAGCRIIINMHHLVLDDQDCPSSNRAAPVITSHILIEPPSPEADPSTP